MLASNLIYEKITITNETIFTHKYFMCKNLITNEKKTSKSHGLNKLFYDGPKKKCY